MIRSDCPIANALDIWGDTWSLLIIRDMMFEQKHHYGEFLLAAEKISTNILAAKLRKLEEAGVISKKRDTAKKTRFVYALTEKGVDMLPIIVETALWSLKHNEGTVLSPHILAQIQADKAGFIQAAQTSLLAQIKML